ncbi:hypothetical protein EDM58_21300 [Brevibacillus panacihumi]|uniref:Uncharacterized protein n=1 Tax=Brevibacillus panacihumi TaxID=497735 RepID=A0A3M8CBD9_9BACL|nr:hypothetical protein EDM58_21300 [Brevibacillus panacihumi]
MLKKSFGFNGCISGWPTSCIVHFFVESEQRENQRKSEIVFFGGKGQFVFSTWTNGMDRKSVIAENDEKRPKMRTRTLLYIMCIIGPPIGW